MAMLDIASEFLTPTEASVVSDVPVRDINRVMDEKIIPKHFYVVGEKRRLRAAACPLIHFYFHSASSLTLELREDVISQVLERGELEKAVASLVTYYSRDVAKVTEEKVAKSDKSLSSKMVERWEIDEDFFKVKFSRFLEATTKRLATLKEATNLVVEDSDILSGTPVIRGTRVPVYDVAASVRKGIPRDRIRAAYPSIDDHAIDLAKIYADARPPRGRPKQTKLGPASTAARRIPRRPRK